MPDRDASASFARFLERSLEVLGREAPLHFAAVRRVMNGLVVGIHINGSAAASVQLETEPWVGSKALSDVTAEIGRNDLVAILEGRLTIEQAMSDGRLELKGELDSMLAFLDALNAWIHGAVRCESLPALYAEYAAASESP